MSKSATQDMAYRQSLMKYAEKYGVSRASRKYNKSRSYIYFWKARWDGTAESLACQSRRPHSHPNQHTEAELKLIRDMRRCNPGLGMAPRLLQNTLFSLKEKYILKISIIVIFTNFFFGLILRNLFYNRPKYNTIGFLYGNRNQPLQRIYFYKTQFIY